MCITDDGFERSRAFLFLVEIKKKFIQNVWPHGSDGDCVRHEHRVLPNFGARYEALHRVKGCGRHRPGARTDRRAEGYHGEKYRKHYEPGRAAGAAGQPDGEFEKQFGNIPPNLPQPSSNHVLAKRANVLPDCGDPAVCDLYRGEHGLRRTPLAELCTQRKHVDSGDRYSSSAKGCLAWRVFHLEGILFRMKLERLKQSSAEG